MLQNYCSFVQELLINDDPEYQWMDKIRTPRTSNETRQKLFLKLSGELQVHLINHTNKRSHSDFQLFFFTVL